MNENSGTDWTEELASISASDGRGVWLGAHPELYSAGTVTRLHEEVLRLGYVDLDKAERLAQASCSIADRLQDDSALALSLRSAANVSYLRGDHASALAAYTRALELLAPLGREVDIGRTLSSGLQTLIYLGRYEEAYDWAARARDIFRRTGDTLRLARLTSNMGNILFRQDRYGDALALYYDAYEQLQHCGEPRDVAAVMVNLAVCATGMGRLKEAAGYYRKAREYSASHGLTTLVVAADYNIAYLYYLRGDYYRAMELYRTARASSSESRDEYHAALCDLDESEMDLELNLSDEAGDLALRAEAAFAALGMRYEQAKAVVNGAIAASQAGEPDRAFRLLRRARRLFVHEGNEVWPAVIDLYQAVLSEQQGLHASADRLCRRAHWGLSKSQLTGKAALCELLGARLALSGGRAAEARRLCIAAAGKGDFLGSPSLRFHANFLLGQIEEERGEAGAALDAYQAAHAEIERLRSRLWADEIKISFLKNKLAVYENLAALHMENGRYWEALDYIEQAKSRSLTDLLALAGNSNADSQGGREIGELQRDLHWHYRQSERDAVDCPAGAEARRAGLQQRRREQEQELSRMLASEQPAPDGMIGIERICSSLPHNAVLVEYCDIRGLMHGCLVTRDRLEIVPLVSSKQIRDTVRLLQFQMAKFRLDRNYLQAFAAPLRGATEAHLRTLYRFLMDPLRSRIDKEHLIVAPHRLLHHLPFHALSDGQRFLMDEFTISYAPSGGVYALATARRPRYEQESLVLGIPDRNAPEIADEARAVAALLPNSRLFLGSDATLEVLREYGASSRYVHIATHGFFRRDNPMFSSVRLGDCHLSWFDLYQLPISAELVTLSGCSTGMNAIVGGDELLGLMRGLLYGGAHSILVSLWDVDDKTTSEFMAAFYGKLAQGSNKARALQEAMRELKERHPHPYYWAPFVLVGSHEAGKN